MNLPNTLPAFNFSIAATVKEITKQFVIGVIYFIACIAAFWVGANLETVPESSAIFIPAGIKIAFYLLSPTRYWITLWISSRALAAHLGYTMTGVWEFNLLHGFWQELCFFALVYVFKHSRWPPSINNSLGILSLILLCVASTSIKWFLFSSAFEFTNILVAKELLQYQLNMCLGDITGSLLVAPFIMLLHSLNLSLKRPALLKVTNLTVTLATVLLVAMLVYLIRPDTYPLLRLASLLPIIWFSYRFGVLGAVSSATLINALIIVEASMTHEPSNTYISQLFILANAITSMVLGAAITELKRKNTELKKINRALTKQLNQNTLLGAKMVSVQENERKHLSQELHDELGQNLTALKTDLAILSHLCDEKTQSFVATLKSNANSMYDSVYQLMHYLRPRELDELGLQNAMTQGRLKSLLTKASIGYEVNFNVDDTLTKEHEIAVYRICQEAVTNCIKHSNATKLIINIKTDSQFIKLEISDNGSKVKQTENSGHYGLAFIQERAIALGGSFKVTNQGGFSIKVKLPISIGR
ncbi:MAG TPA: sensor histidine kinase [Pseudoalteromonas sp.]|uniref:Histidine kinase domain-containing protein n=1 Tax=marine sediment metagenome TaxID=412755 RepID=A0A0F9UR90_9ZZZZ|nr:MASE1 domain-containing protein [Pseudoalteromonas sp.]HDZ33798.1 sensor histidine kinase [Pseudoalteromonas sp.]